MQQTKRRSKKGVILLALAFALFVMAIAPASAFAAASFITINDGPLISSKTVNITYSSQTPGNVGIQFVWIRDWWRPGPTGAWQNLSPTSPVYVAYAAGTTVGPVPYTLQSRSVPATGDQFQVTTDFYGAAAAAYPLVEIGPFSNIVTWNNAAPHSTVAFSPAGSLGRGGVPWTNGGLGWLPPFGGVWAQFNENNFAYMGTTHWSIGYAGVDYPQQSLYWLNDTPPGQVQIVGPNPFLPTNYPFTDNGIYTITHWAVSKSGVTQPGAPSSDAIGYDTKLPEVTWSAVPDWSTQNIPFTATISDSAGSGVAGVSFAAVFVSFNDGASWALNTGTAINPQRALVTTQDTFDMFKFYVKGIIAVIPNTHAMYQVRLWAEDIAGNGKVYYLDPNVDNMPPSTTVQSVSPAGAQTFMNWTNKDVTVTLLATDAGGNGVPSGVKSTEYFIGDSGTTSPKVGSTASGPAAGATGTQTSTTNPTSVLINKNAPVGPVYLFYRSIDKAGNAEAWKVVWIWFDNKAPVLSSNSKGLWYRTSFPIKLTAIDPNSEISPAGIEYQVPGWPFPVTAPGTPAILQLPTTWTALPGNPGTVIIPVDPYPLSRTDGIWNLNYRAWDNAGNASLDTTLTAKIDTRPPTTVGTAGVGASNWVNGIQPYTLTATDQAIGAGVKVTFYRVDQSTPWQQSVDATATTTFATALALFAPVQGAVHTIDFFSIDNATTVTTSTAVPFPGNMEQGVIVGTWTPTGFYPASVTGYKSSTVMLDVTAPVVTAIDPKNGEWQKGPAIVNFSGTDVGSGYAYTEWSTDGGTTWTKANESAEVGGNSPKAGTVVTYRGVDMVGIKSANATITVKVASTPPTVAANNASVTRGNKASFKFTVTAVTPKAPRVIIQIRTRSGQTLSSHNFANVDTNAQVSRSFRINLPKGKYNIRISAVDEAGNVQTRRGAGTLTVK